MEHHDSLLSAWTDSLLTTCSPALYLHSHDPTVMLMGTCDSMPLPHGDICMTSQRRPRRFTVSASHTHERSRPRPAIPYGVGDCPWSSYMLRTCSLPSLLPQLLTRFLCLLQSTLPGLRQTVLDPVVHATTRAEFMLRQVVHIGCAQAR